MIQFRSSVFLVLVVVVLLFVVSCSSSTPSSSMYNFRSGISEIQITDDSVFPLQVSNRDPFEVRLVLQNKAAYDLTNVKVGLVGLDSDKILVDEPEQEVPEFFGRSLSYPEGDRREVVFTGSVASLKLAGDDGRKDTFQAYVSYDSTVELSYDLCVSGASMVVNDGGCMPDDTPQRLSGQGAPIAITDVYEQASGDRGQVRFTLENRGSGDAVYAVLGNGGGRMATLGGMPISCQFLSEFPARFEFGEKKSVDVSCSFDLQAGGRSYSSPLYVQIGYGYRYWEDHSVVVRRTGGGSAPIDPRLLS